MRQIFSRRGGATVTNPGARMEVMERRLVLSASVSGVIYLDANGDGLRDAGEQGLAGRKVFLDANATREWEAGETYVLSGPDGSYRFDGLPAGTARVLHVVPDGWKATMTNRTTDPFDSLSLTDGQSAVADYGSVPAERGLRLDPSFGSGGIVSVGTPWGLRGSPPRTYAVADGSVFLHVEASNGTQYLRRMAPDGSVDATFGGPQGVAFSDVTRRVALQPDGKVLVATLTGVYRYNVNGTRDNTFGFSGFASVGSGGVSDPNITDLELDSAGRILVAATSRQSNTGQERQFQVVRLTPQGAVNMRSSTLMGLGSGTQPAVAAAPDGKVVAAFGRDPNWSDSIVRWKADGTVDTTFGAGGFIWGTWEKPLTLLRDVVVQPDGRILAAGVVDSAVNSGSSFAVLRYTVAGQPDETFGTGEIPGQAQTAISSRPGSGSVSQILLEADGRITVVGTVGPASRVPDVGVARYTPDGRLDRSFAGGGFGHLNLSGDIDSPRGIYRVGGKLRVFARTNWNPGYARWVQLDETPSPVASLGAGGVLTVTGTAGNDTIELREDPTYVRVTVNGITAAYYAPSLTQVKVLAGGGDDSTTVDLRTRIPTSVLGEEGADALVIRGTAGADNILLTPGVTSIGPVLVTHGAESVTVLGLAGDDAIDLDGFYEGTSLTLDGGEGDDTFGPRDPNSQRLLDFWRGEATFVGGAGHDTLLLDDRKNISGYAFEVDAASVTRTLTPPILYSGLERLTIQAGPGDNGFFVTPSPLTAIELRAGEPSTASGPWDSLELTPRGAIGGAYAAGPAAGSGAYTFANRQPVTFTGVELLSADLTPPSVGPLAFVPGGGGKAAVRVTFGEDVGQSLAAGDVVLTNPATGESRPATAVSFDPDSRTATFTLPALADGNWRATVPAGGVEDAAGNPLAADAALDFFVLTGDVDRNRVVNFDDLLILASNYNKTGKTWADGDLDGNGTVNFDDLLILAGKYNTSLPAPTPVAEPVTTPPPVAASLVKDETASKSVFSTARLAKPAAKPTPPAKLKVAVRPKGR